MSSFVKRLEIERVHGRLDILLDFKRDINVLYGRNGSGKTTVLHIVANILNGSFERFVYLDFSRILLTTGEGRTLELVRTPSEAREATISLHLDSKLADTIDIKRSVDELAGERSSRAYLEASSKRWEAAVSQLSLGPAAYFPAFRSMIEAWSSSDQEDLDRRAYYRYLPEAEDVESYTRMISGRYRPVPLTALARALFGQFIPKLNFPSPLRIERDLSEEVQLASYRVSRASEHVLSEAFIQAFSALADGSRDLEEEPDTKIFEDIRELLEQLDETRLVKETDSDSSDVYGRLREIVPAYAPDRLSPTAANVLSVYRRSLMDQVKIQRREFSPISRYVSSVNEFLEGKCIRILPPKNRPSETRVAVEFPDHSTIGLRALSSGEREILSMLYAASHAGSGHVVLIDEPELSLHIDWQRMLIRKMAEQLGRRQIIVCTHSPMIGAEYEDRYQEVSPIVHEVASNEATPSSLVKGEERLL
jgi:predicted ATP-binding protein involved in virulence